MWRSECSRFSMWSYICGPRSTYYIISHWISSQARAKYFSTSVLLKTGLNIMLRVADCFNQVCFLCVECIACKINKYSCATTCTQQDKHTHRDGVPGYIVPSALSIHYKHQFTPPLVDRLSIKCTCVSSCSPATIIKHCGSTWPQMDGWVDSIIIILGAQHHCRIESSNSRTQSVTVVVAIHPYSHGGGKRSLQSQRVSGVLPSSELRLKTERRSQCPRAIEIANNHKHVSSRNVLCVCVYTRLSRVYHSLSVSLVFPTTDLSICWPCWVVTIRCTFACGCICVRADRHSGRLLTGPRHRAMSAVQTHFVHGINVVWTAYENH